jgi:hypothetical protein
MTGQTLKKIIARTMDRFQGMPKRHTMLFVALMLLSAASTACGVHIANKNTKPVSSQVDPRAPLAPTPRSTMLEELTRWPKPLAANTMAEVLSQTAAIVEGDVTDIHYEYEPYLGPRTRVRLSNLVVVTGQMDATEISIDVLGGPLPDGSILSVSESPSFVVPARYIVFLRNTYWFYSPEAADVLRVESVFGREVLVNDQGFPVETVDSDGFGYGDKRLFDATLHQVKPFGRPTPARNVSPNDLGHTLDRQNFHEAVSNMGKQLNVFPNGAFLFAPIRATPWNITPTAPPGH